jgi:hypothetical protein
MKTERIQKQKAPKDRPKNVKDLGARAAAPVRGGRHRHHNDNGDDIVTYDVRENKV